MTTELIRLPQLREPGPGEVRVSGLFHPFRFDDRRDYMAPAGATIAEMLAATGADPILLRSAYVFLGDDLIAREYWHVVRPKPGTAVTVRVVPQGGGGGKNPLATVLSIAVIAAAVVTQQYYVLPALASAGITGTAASLAGSAFVLAATTLGSMAINAIVPPPRPDAMSSRGLDGSGGTTYRITGAANVANPFGVVPRVFGRHRVFPKLAAKQFTEIEGQDQYLVCLFDFGTGPLTLSDFRIGDTPLTSFEDYELTVLNGQPSDSVRDLVYRNRNESFPVNARVLAADSWRSFTVADADEVILDWSWPQGCYIVKRSDGSTTSLTVRVNIRYRAVGTSVWTDVSDVVATTGMSSAGKRGAILRSRRIKFPSRGNYEIEYRRRGSDADATDAGNPIIAATFFTQYRVVQKSAPVDVVSVVGVNCLAALRIKAQAGAQGQIQAFNAMARATVQRWTGSTLVDTTSRHPAWAFLDVLINDRVNRPDRIIPLAKIDLDSLLDWATNDPDRTFDAVIDTETTRMSLLRDIAAAGRARFSKRDGKYGVVRDVAQATPVQLFTPKNSWGFSGEKVFVDQPHALRCRFLDEDADYQWAERIVYADGYSASNATKYEQVEMFGVTDPALVWKDGRYLLACGQLRPETWSFFADIEHIVCTRGDLIRVAHDVPNGGDERTQGRIKAVLTDEGSPEMVTGFTLDEPAEMVGGETYVLQGRKSDGTPVQYSLVTSAGKSFDVELLTPVSLAAALEVGDLYAFGTAERVSRNMIVTRIQPGADLTAQIFCVDEAPGVHDADKGTIPDYDPGIADSREIAPPPPVSNLTLVEDTDLSAGIPVSSLAISWDPSGQAVSGYEVWRFIEADEADGDTWVLQAVTPSPGYRFENQEPGQEFIIAVVAVSVGGRKLTPETAAQGRLTLVGVPVPDVTGFAISVLDNMATLSWDDAARGTVAYYEIRYSPALSGATWGTASPLLPRVDATSVQVPALVGTYLIKAVNSRGLKSSNAASIVSNVALFAGTNVVETLEEGPTFIGEKEQIRLSDTLGGLVLDYDGDVFELDDVFGVDDFFFGTEGTYDEGYYYFSETVDLGEVYTSRLKIGIVAHGVSLTEDIFLRPDIFELEDFFNVDPSAWGVSVEMRSTADDPASSPAEWSEWMPLVVGDHTARAYEFRARLTSQEFGITPVVEDLVVTVDMPDRAVAGEDIVVPVTGLRVSFAPAYRALKGLGISAQGLATGDYYEITNKDETGYDIIFRNAAGVAVERTHDFVAIGYGRVEA